MKSFLPLRGIFRRQSAFETFLSESFAPFEAVCPVGNFFLLFVKHKK